LSWFNNLVQTYDNVSDIVGKPQEIIFRDKKGNETKIVNTLLPPNHMTAKTDICVTIDKDGNFRRAAGEKDTMMNIVIPCTEDSSTRAGKVEYPHPLHDQIGYLSSNEKKRKAYLSQLANWSGAHPKVESVHKYMMKNTLIDDLRETGIKTDEKLFVRFCVEAPGDCNPNLWEDFSVIKAWQDYCSSSETDCITLCYATGESLPAASKHPKGINPSANGAKLISCNDETNYTYKGRFNKSEQANSISASASHKAHAMLKYLIATQGHKCDTQAVVAWSIDDGNNQPNLFDDSLGIYANAVKTDREALIEAQNKLGFDYSANLNGAIRGRGNPDNLKNFNKHVAVIAVDAATTGRMAITFYKDLSENEYVERIVKWHKTCCWHFRGKGKDYTSAPSSDKIIAAVYGEPKGEGYSKIKKQTRERILSFILNGGRIDKSWLIAAVNRVSNPFSYDKSDGGWDIHKWESAVNVTCAIAKKYYSVKEEEFSLKLEKTRNDRSYLYGRMLAIADKIESHARYLQTGKNDTDKRPTNAVRYMNAFSTKPFRTWELIVRQLNPYIQRLNGGEWYQGQLDEIMSLFKEGEYEDNKSLDGKYLMGYSLQRRDFNNKNNVEETGNVEQED
jgi:CRISPR-associated protein Csd1